MMDESSTSCVNNGNKLCKPARMTKWIQKASDFGSRWNRAVNNVINTIYLFIYLLPVVDGSFMVALVHKSHAGQKHSGHCFTTRSCITKTVEIGGIWTWDPSNSDCIQMGIPNRPTQSSSTSFIKIMMTIGMGLVIQSATCLSKLILKPGMCEFAVSSILQFPVTAEGSSD